MSFTMTTSSYCGDLTALSRATFGRAPIFFIRTTCKKNPTENLQAKPNSRKIDRFFNLAAEHRLKGRTGLYMQSHFPRRGSEKSYLHGPTLCFRDLPIFFWILSAG